MAKVTAMQNSKKRPEYKPDASYKWEPTDLFELTGQQFASLYHCLTREVNTAEGSSIALKYEAFNTVLDIFKRGVEQGVITEVDDLSQGIEGLEKDVNRLFKPE